MSANEKNIPAHSIKTLCLLKLGKYDEVINYFDSIPAEVVIPGEKIGSIGLAYAFQKDIENTAIYLRQIEDMASDPNGVTADSFLFLMLVAMGEHDRAFEWVTQAIKKKSSLLLLRYSDPAVNAIKNDPRYDPLRKTIYKTDSGGEATKNKKSLLDESTADDFTAQLLDYITEKKPYLDPLLSLRSLAIQIGIHPNQLSWLLNESLGKNFNEFINHYRVETFKSLSLDPKNANITIMGLAYDSGFNSKTVFNTYFKKETGLTPKQFLKQA